MRRARSTRESIATRQQLEADRSTPLTTQQNRHPPFGSTSSAAALQSPRTLTLDFEAGKSLLERAASAAMAKQLESHGYAVLQLSSAEAVLVRRAGAFADKSLAFEEHTNIPQTGGAKRNLYSVRRSPMLTLMDLLHATAAKALTGVSSHLGLPSAHFERLLLNDDDDEDASSFSSMRSSAPPDCGDFGEAGDCDKAGGCCPEYDGRGLLTLITGQTAPTLEVFDRRQGAWLRPLPTSADASCSDGDGDAITDGNSYVVLLVGATLYRSTAGLVPREAHGEIGACRHRVPQSPAGETHRCLVLRLNAQPTRCFDCQALYNKPGVVTEFVSGEESVEDFLASTVKTGLTAAASLSKDRAPSAETVRRDRLAHSWQRAGSRHPSPCTIRCAVRNRTVSAEKPGLVGGSWPNEFERRLLAAGLHKMSNVDGKAMMGLNAPSAAHSFASQPVSSDTGRVFVFQGGGASMPASPSGATPPRDAPLGVAPSPSKQAAVPSDFAFTFVPEDWHSCPVPAFTFTAAAPSHGGIQEKDKEEEFLPTFIPGESEGQEQVQKSSTLSHSDTMSLLSCGDSLGLGGDCPVAELPFSRILV